MNPTRLPFRLALLGLALAGALTGALLSAPAAPALANDGSPTPTATPADMGGGDSDHR